MSNMTVVVQLRGILSEKVLLLVPLNEDSNCVSLLVVERPGYVLSFIDAVSFCGIVITSSCLER